MELRGPSRHRLGGRRRCPLRCQALPHPSSRRRVGLADQANPGRHHERESLIEEAILVFEDLSNALYEKAGSLTVRATPNGPSVDVRIDAQSSKGITNMQIFCFDLMLAGGAYNAKRPGAWIPGP